MEDIRVILLYNGIKFVRGSKCSALYDLDNSEILLLYLENNNETDLNEFQNFIFCHEISSEIEKQITSCNYGLITSYKELNKYIIPTNNYFLPFQLNTFYVEFGNKFDIEGFLKNLPNCLNVIFNVKIFNVLHLTKLLENLDINPSVLNIEIVTEFEENKFNFFSKIKNTFKKISKVILYSANVTEQIINLQGNNIQIIKTDRNLSDFEILVPSKEYHSINRVSFHTALKNNLFYYKKIWLDEFGYLKFENLNRFPEFGNYFFDTINWDLIFDKNHFPKEIQLPKSKIRDCNSSIFRYCCNDPRIPEFDSTNNEYFYKNGCLCKQDI